MKIRGILKSWFWISLHQGTLFIFCSRIQGYMLSLMNEVDPCLFLSLCILYEMQNQIFQQYIYIYIWARWVFEIIKAGQIILIISVVKILVWSQVHSWLFIYLYWLHYVGLHNTHVIYIHVLNYTRNVTKFCAFKHQKMFSCSFSKLLPNIGK